ncbi:MAG TPA: hypothetical protein VLA62_13995 [Solirubrobacterales bacterium]|nr:hypothetical protein [Solirubrobacterales bacterium]
MQELHYLIMGQFLVSLLMGLGALCLFFWAAVSGPAARRGAGEVPGPRHGGHRR